MYFNILFPEGYDNETDRYPVVYLFRGAVDEWADPSEDNSRRGNIKTVYDTLYAKKKLGKMILIMPGLGAPAPEIEYLYVINELLPYVDTHFRTIPTRWHRAIDGFSLGGLIVTNFLAGTPQYFASVGSYDGTLSLFDNAKFISASNQLIYSIKQMQLLYHTASLGGNNHNNNMTTFSILNAKGIVNALPSYGLDPNAQHNWYYADWHTAITLPLHWAKIQSVSNSLSLAFKTQFNGQSISGTNQIDWSRVTVPNPITTHLLYSKDNGKQWTVLFTTDNNDSTWSWNTVPLPDGTRYKIKIIAAGDTLFGSTASGSFTINNPGNGAPDVEFVNLNARDTVYGNYTMYWSAADADGDVVTLTLDISYNEGVSWNTIATAIPNSGSFQFTTRTLANSSSVLFRISASDGLTETKSVSPALIINNKRVHLTNAFFDHLSGHSDATFAAMGMNIDSLWPANYTMTFSNLEGKKRYSVFNSKGVEVVKNATELDGKSEGPLFDGFRLLIQDYTVPVVNVDSTRWITGSSTLEAEVKLLDLILESGTVTAVPYPSDYEIRFSNTITDTTLSLYGALSQPVPFFVWNKTLNKKTKIIFVEIDGNGVLSRNDELYFIEYDSMKTPILTWHIQFVGTETATNPAAGDLFLIKIMKPLTANDRYRFMFTPPLAANPEQLIPGSYSLTQNFPNPFNPSTTISFTIPGSALTGKNVAAENTSIMVYDILGRRIATLVDESLPAGNYSIIWNASEFASGVYFYRLHSGEFSKTKSMLFTK